MRHIIAKQEVCMGCGLCEVYCLVEHSKSKDIIKAYKKEYPKPVSRIRLEKAQPVSLSIQCQHCDNPPCVFSCLSGAMRIDKQTGKVTHNEEKCIGCWTCIMVCPFGAVLRDPNGAKVVAKCDLCPNLEIPACVSNCPNEALTYEEVYS